MINEWRSIKAEGYPFLPYHASLSSPQLPFDHSSIVSFSPLLLIIPSNYDVSMASLSSPLPSLSLLDPITVSVHPKAFPSSPFRRLSFICHLPHRYVSIVAAFREIFREIQSLSCGRERQMD